MKMNNKNYEIIMDCILLFILLIILNEFLFSLIPLFSLIKSLLCEKLKRNKFKYQTLLELKNTEEILSRRTKSFTVLISEEKKISHINRNRDIKFASSKKKQREFAFPIIIESAYSSFYKETSDNSRNKCKKGTKQRNENIHKNEENKKNHELHGKYL